MHVIIDCVNKHRTGNPPRHLVSRRQIPCRRCESQRGQTTPTVDKTIAHIEPTLISILAHCTHGRNGKTLGDNCYSLSIADSPHR